MSKPSLALDQTVAKGEQVYDQKLANILEPHHVGKYVVIEVESGDYEIDKEHIAALKRLSARHPGKFFYATRVGYRTLGTIGGRMKARA